MELSTFWWIATAVAVVAELASGTFFLLMIALGLAAAAVAAHLQTALTTQLLCAALLGGGAVALWTLLRSRRPESAPASANPDVNIDIGQRVHVSRWASDGSARVRYRGAEWSARWQGAAAGEPPPPAPGEFVIRALQGNQLVVGRE